MRIATVREFRDNASGLLRFNDPIPARAGGRLTGVFSSARGYTADRFEG
jgi:hypothetical protein